MGGFVMEHSEQINEIATALAKAQGAMKAPEKNRTVKVRSQRTNTEYEFSYSTFDALIEAARKPLTDNGIAFMQFPDVRGSIVTIDTMLVHASGQFFRNTLVLSAADSFPQSLGSAISYGKRYAFAAMLGLAGEEDDDANAAEGNDAEKKAKPRGAARGRDMEAQGSAPARTTPAAASPTESKAVAFDAAETMFRTAGVEPVNDQHPERAKYLSWVRGCFSQALGKDVQNIASLDPAHIRSGAVAIVKLITTNAIEPWKPDTKEPADA